MGSTPKKIKSNTLKVSPVDDTSPSKSESQLAELANTKDNARQIVLMSKKIVLIASSHLSLTAHNVKHEDKVTVEWCKDRRQVQSLTLIENGTSSVISMCDGSSVPLSFKSAHDCISFTHVFYNINVPSVSTLNISCGSDQQV